MTRLEITRGDEEKGRTFICAEITFLKNCDGTIDQNVLVLRCYLPAVGNITVMHKADKHELFSNTVVSPEDPGVYTYTFRHDVYETTEQHLSFQTGDKIQFEYAPGSPVNTENIEYLLPHFLSPTQSNYT